MANSSGVRQLLYGGLPSPPSLDLAVTKVDEVITITPDGQVKLDVDVAVIGHPRGSPPVTAEVKGPALIHVLATGGVMQPRGGDFSGWRVLFPSSGPSRAPP